MAIRSIKIKQNLVSLACLLGLKLNRLCNFSRNHHPSDDSLKLVSARDWRYDRYLTDYATEPPTKVIQQELDAQRAAGLQAATPQGAVARPRAGQAPSTTGTGNHP